MKEHNKNCIEEGFNSSIEFKRLLNYEQGEGGIAEILFEEVCESCGVVIGKEIQTFKYQNTR